MNRAPALSLNGTQPFPISGIGPEFEPMLRKAQNFADNASMAWDIGENMHDLSKGNVFGVLGDVLGVLAEAIQQPQQEAASSDFLSDEELDFGPAQ